MVALRSLNLHQCANGKCGHSQEWSLDEGQQPLLGNNRQSRWTDAWRKYKLAESPDDAVEARRELDKLELLSDQPTKEPQPMKKKSTAAPKKPKKPGMMPKPKSTKKDGLNSYRG
jgi:hypothetical protein